MNPALWGGVCALGLGTADFLARFSSRAIGHASALLGMLLTGAVILSLWVWATDPPMVWTWSGWHLLVLNGVATTIMTLLLYKALARGPVSIVAPIVASHPVLVVALAVVLGARPSVLQWGAMAFTLIGTLIVARSAERFEEPGIISRAFMRTTILISLASALAYAVLVAAGQYAVPVYGELQTLWLGRLISLAAILVFFLARAEKPSLPFRWWPVLITQGLLDAGGYLALFAGSHGAGSEIAAVTASTFGAVTTLMARLILRESIGAMQWLGIFMIFAGVAALSA